MTLAQAREITDGADLKGKRAIVVGATAGIGLAIAMQLARCQADVTIVGRSAERGASIVQDLRALGGVRHNFVSCDCYLLRNVQECVASLTGSHPDGVDYLVLCQGMGSVQGFTASEEGLDQKLTLHYYSRACFIQGLLPLLRDRKAHVLTVLSAGVHASYKGYSTDPELSLGGYSLKNAADAAGFYNDIMVDSVSRAEPSIGLLHIAPGFISTNWGTELPCCIRGCIRMMQCCCGRTMEDCGHYMCAGLLGQSHMAGGFKLLDQFGQSGPTVTHLHEAAREEVWAHTKAVLAANKAIAGEMAGECSDTH